MGFGHSELDVSAGRRDLGRPGLALVVLSVVELRPRALPPTALTSISRSTRPWHRSPQTRTCGHDRRSQPLHPDARPAIRDNRRAPHQRPRELAGSLTHAPTFEDAVSGGLSPSPQVKIPLLGLSGLADAREATHCFSASPGR